jgi:hypothetical protein
MAAARDKCGVCGIAYHMQYLQTRSGAKLVRTLCNRRELIPFVGLVGVRAGGGEAIDGAIERILTAMNGISSSRLAFVKAMSQPSAMPEIVITGWARPAKGRPRQRPSGRLCGSHSLPIAAGGIPLRRRYLAFRRSLPSFWALSGVSSGSIPAGKGQNDSIETGDWSATAFPRGQAASERGH